MPVWGHAWVQPASALEQAAAGQDGVVHAAGLAGELFSAEERDTLVNDGNLQMATAEVATVGSAHDPRILAALDSMAAPARSSSPLSTPPATAWPTSMPGGATCRRCRRTTCGPPPEFGMEVTREAVSRGVRISAGSDHVAYGPASERASLLGELQLWSTRSPSPPRLRCWRLPGTPPGPSAASRAGGSAPSRPATTPTWCCSSKNPLEDIENLDAVEWVMQGGRIWRPGQLRSGIAMR